MATEKLDFKIGIDDALKQMQLDNANAAARQAETYALLEKLDVLRTRREAMTQHNLIQLAAYKDGSGCYLEEAFAGLEAEQELLVNRLSELAEIAANVAQRLQREADIAHSTERV